MVSAVVSLLLAIHEQIFKHVFDINDLRAHLDDPDARVRRQAVQQLCIIGDPAATEALLPLLQDESAEVRTYAVQALAVMRDVRALPALCAAYERDEMLGLRPDIITAVGNTNDEAALPLLLRALNESTPLVRSAALHALRKYYDPRVNDAMLPFLTGDDKEAKLSALAILSRAHDPRAFAAIIAMLTDKDDAIRMAATTAMICYRDADALPALIMVLRKDKITPIRTQAAYALGVIKDNRAVDPLSSALLNFRLVFDKDLSNSFCFIDAMIFALGNIGDERAIPPLLAAVNTRQYEKIAWALQQFGTKGIKPLKDALKKNSKSMSLSQGLTLVANMHDAELTNFAFKAALKRNELDNNTIFTILAEPRSMRGGVSHGLAVTNLWYIAFRLRYRQRNSALCGPLVDEKIIEMLASSHSKSFDWSAREVRNPALLDTLLQIASPASDVNTKQNVSMALANYNDERVVPLMISLFDENFTASCCQQCLLATNDLRDISPLFPLLVAENKETRKIAAAALAIIGDTRAIPPLLDMLASDAHSECREFAAKALGIIGDRRALPALKNALFDPVEWTRSAVHWAIGEIGVPNVVNDICTSAMENIRNYTRVGKSLLQLGDNRGYYYLVQAMHADDMMARTLALHGLAYSTSSVSHNIIRAALGDELTAEQALTEICANPQAADAPALLDLLHEKYCVSKREIAKALGGTGDKRALPALHSIMINSIKDDEIIAAAAALIRLGAEQEAVPMLLGKLANYNKVNLNSVIIALAEAKDPAIITPLAGKLTDSDPLTVAIAARALALHGDKRGNEALLRVLMLDEEELVLRAAARFAGEVNAPRFVAPLVKLTQTGKLYVRLEAADALGKIGGKAAVTALADMLKEDRSRLREAAALGLKATADNAAIPALKAAQKCETATKVQDAIAAALQVIG